MYKVYRYRKPLKSLGTFFSYDEARNAARRFIRKLDTYDSFWMGHTNPNLGEFGITVKRT